MKQTVLLILTGFLTTSAVVLAQSPSDRAATAQMHLTEVTTGLNAKQRAAQSLQGSINQSDTRIAELEAKQADKPKFASLYTDEIRKEKATKQTARAQLDKMNQDIADLEQAKLKYDQELGYAKEAAAREKKNNPDPQGGDSLKEALGGKSKK